MSDQEAQPMFLPPNAKEAEESSRIKEQCDGLRRVLEVLLESADEEELATARREMLTYLTNIQNESEEMLDQIDRLEGEVPDLKERTDTGEAEFGDIKWATQGSHNEQIMDALADAIEKGRPLHLLEYLQAYKSDLEK